ncbi:MAG: transcription termination factor NusA [Alkalibacterium gilvum]|uniref:Transcription termination/antitermination protein NusA n=1 Tax=Alkalibacterium gilvum TaxID=1130080 RepID=A0A1H6RB80_9LACT|nr:MULTISPECIES: transcription termination factor NusA [Alkalibacterium]MDN6193498.1 transcription termination factor NusA [Alkalibacterium sp.]MDN6293083.1 transcription termination factor NusA [Alkalibacterium sp.]MDN6294742.1 transcription termination factor NusA [Alkalibacterium sp.]MDN6397652.1 transcription termination factor NusA [Alkalibacterium sp.]MDN6728590.1 transcription termination factor NusA [Alkalibacterium sp.]
MSKELASALETLEKEKGISKEIVIDALEAALVSAYKRNYGTSQNVEVDFNEKKGSITVYQVKEVVEDVYDSQLEISLEEARELKKAYELGDKIKFKVTPKNFGRIAAQTAKQVIMQRMREAERSIIYNEYIEYEDDLMTGTVERQDNKFIYINLGKVEAVLSQRDQIENETYETHDRIKVYVSKVENSTKGPQVFVSRTHPNLIKRLFEQEVPEIYDGIVEVVSIAREAGDRSKIAVFSRDENVDPVGTCVGPRGARVQAIVNELHGENMDIVEWDKDPAVYIKNALNPAQVVDVQFDEDQHSCIIVVPDYQLSLAIGKRGQNVRLAAKLTGFKIDIKSESDMEALSNESEELKDDAFLEALNENDADATNDLESISESPSLFEDDDSTEVEQYKDSDVSDDSDSTVLAEDSENMDRQPGEPVMETDFQAGQLNPNQAEDLVEFAEERDGMGEEESHKASMKEVEEATFSDDDENSGE